MGIFSSMRSEEIIDYLREQPDDIYLCMNALNKDENKVRNPYGRYGKNNIVN